MEVVAHLLYETDVADAFTFTDTDTDPQGLRRASALL